MRVKGQGPRVDEGQGEESLGETEAALPVGWLMERPVLSLEILAGGYDSNFVAVGWFGWPAFCREAQKGAR